MKSDINLKARRANLGITEQDCTDCHLPIQNETLDLVEAEHDIFDRPQHMTPTTKRYWHKMKYAAAEDAVILQLVSAYRSFDYQCNLIQRKLDSGSTIHEILQVNAIPGFSEHHTGRALDLTTNGCKALEEDFEKTPAFKWLVRNAGRFFFQMSYPKDNAYGIAYEPWHWTCQQEHVIRSKTSSSSPQ